VQWGSRELGPCSRFLLLYCLLEKEEEREEKEKRKRRKEMGNFSKLGNFWKEK
jgi:hypothetical protein